MRDIDHTNPHTGDAFGANGGVFTRGPAAADGGTEGEEMRDVEHEAPDGDGANEVWERGEEHEHERERERVDDGASTADEAPTDEVKSDEAVGEGDT